ncbi:mandelate racemase/muconate lactonizing enzyme family protein [Mangrovicella endophytica]|uniref:mandelate racemase/muconate lactonizing enzyme family protein n=1 Tax=Mangrovicella endophytica TaxID=2066697 RepID=UPI0018E4A7DD|nr:mandelate racemase/muconate lactonizing enzyme family protein [Mangrovicella endophytica]
MEGTAERIVKIEGFTVACDMPHAAGNALRTFTRRSSLLLRLTTAGGLSGWGESWAFPDASGAFIRKMLAPAVLGASVTNPRKLHAEMLRRVIPDRRGQAHMAISAIDLAAWDALGRALQRPIHALLGGALRDSVTIYASGPLLPAGADRYEGFRTAVEGYAKAGFSAVKIRVASEMRAGEAAIRQAREILGPDRQLMIDLNEGSTFHDALTLAHRVADMDLRWIEEPLRHDDLPAYRALAERMPVPLAGGESFCGVEAFRDPVAQRTLDILQPDLALCGGFTEALRISGLASAFGVPVIPHVWGSAINVLAALQFCATIAHPDGGRPLPLLEFDASYNPLRSVLLDPKPSSDGTIAVPDGPGLGMEIEIDRLAQYVTDHWVVE